MKFTKTRLFMFFILAVAAGMQTVFLVVSFSLLLPLFSIPIDQSSPGFYNILTLLILLWLLDIQAVKAVVSDEERRLHGY